MLKKLISVQILAFLFGALSLSFAQTAPVKPSALTGDVVSVDTSKIVLQTKDNSLDVLLTEKTEFKRVPPEKPTLSAAVSSALSDIGVGDKLLVTGVLSEDKKSLPARAVYLMTKSDIAQKNTKESEQWATRSISGRVASINPNTLQITLETRSLMGSATVILTPKAGAKFMRYAPNSVKFSEAKASEFSELQAGDMLRALGDKSADGVSFQAETIVTGAFQTVAGTVKTVDAAANEVVITDLQTKKDITVSLASATTLKKFPEEMAQRMAQFSGGAGGAGGAAPNGPRPAGAGVPPAGANGAGGPGGPGRGGFGGRGGGIDDMLERFPNITAADLKAGDMIAVSSSKTSNTDRITAIKLLAGVEPFVRAAQAQTAAGGQRGGGRGGQGGFSIPGLDGFDFP
ncbi:MAG: hypothetical protein ACT4O9_04000 [Blastocatellia bacterium]